MRLHNYPTLEKLTEREEILLQNSIPRGYPLSEYIENVSSLGDKLDELIKDGYEYLKEKDFSLAATTFDDVSDLGDICKSLCKVILGMLSLR